MKTSSTAEKQNCKYFLLAKSTKLLTTSPRSNTHAPLDLIHSDLSGTFSIQARGGLQYYVSFIDDFFCYTHLYPLKTKDGALTGFKQYAASVETQLGAGVKTLLSDNGEEYVNKVFDEYLLAKGNSHQLVALYTHESNGRVERFNRTLFQMIRTSLLSSGLLKNKWGEAANMAVYVKNTPFHSALSTTTFEACCGRSPASDTFEPLEKLAMPTSWQKHDQLEQS